MLKQLLALGIAVIGAGLWSCNTVSAATTLTSCQTISTAGDYVLGQSVSSGGTCFSIRASNVTFDGGNHTITVGSGDAVEVAYYGSGSPAQNVVVKNVQSPGGMRAYGDTLRYLTFENNTIEGLTNFGADDVTIRNNTVGQEGISISNADQDTWAPYRNTVTGNTVTGGSTNVKILLEVVGGKYHPCPRLDTIITNNTVTSTRNDPPPEATAAVRIRCATHTVFTDNTVESTGTTIGLYMRDESDDGQYLRNTFTTNSQEVLRIASGNADKTFPARNTFANNVFHARNGRVTYFQGIGSDNTFTNNLFWSRDSGFIGGAEGNIFNHNTFFVENPGDSIHAFDYDHGPADQYTNNIFSYSGAATVYSFDGWATNRYVGQNNLFHNRTGNVRFTNYGTLTQWQASVSETGSIEGDPSFVNPSAGNFALATSSIAKSRGTDGLDLGYSPTTAVTVTPTPATPTAPTTSTTVTVPRLSLPSPTRNARLTGVYRLRIGASDPDGIASVRLLVDGRMVSRDTTSPYRVILDTRPFRNGKHTVTVVATDRTGTTTTIRRPVTTRNRFQTALSLTTARTNVHGNVGLRPKYLYGGLTVRRVLYLLDGREIGRSTSAPYRVVWNSRRARNGTHALTIRAVDAVGASTSETLTIRIRN